MSNDNTSGNDLDQLQEKFDNAVSLVVDEFQKAGMHSAWMTPVLEKWLEWSKAATREADKQR